MSENVNYELPFYLSTRVIKGNKITEKEGKITAYEYNLSKAPTSIKNYSYEKLDLSELSPDDIPTGAGFSNSNEKITANGIQIAHTSSEFDQGGYNEITVFDLEYNIIKYAFVIESKENVTTGVTTYTLYAERYLNDVKSQRLNIANNTTGSFEYYFFIYAGGANFDTAYNMYYCSPNVSVTNGSISKVMTSPGKIKINTDSKQFAERKKFEIIQNEETAIANI